MEKDSLKIQHDVYLLLSQQSNCVGIPAGQTHPLLQGLKNTKTFTTQTGHEIHDIKSFYLTGHMKQSSIYESGEETGKENL